MKWQVKALVQKAISKLPYFGRVNYILQRYVTKNLPMSEFVWQQKITAAGQHLQAFKSHDETIKSDAVAYEFGAGYDLAIPIILGEEGLKKQVVTDLNPLLKKELVNDVLYRRGSTTKRIMNSVDLKNKTGIDYYTKIDARNTGFITASFDYIHSTDTLEHIPKHDVLPILQECYRLLKPGGIISCIIDLQDHYQYADNSISPFNFYQYSWEEWDRKYNNKLHYQNRLLAHEYYSFFVTAGFAPIQMQVQKPDSADIFRLQSMSLHTHFANKPIEDISNLRCHIWAEKPD